MSCPPLAQMVEASALRADKCGFESLKGDHPTYGKWKIYGPYKRKDLRQHVIAYNGTQRITISFPKFIVECILGRELFANEEVHHKNGLEFDDRIENFEVREKKDHAREHINSECFTCPMCNRVFILEGTKLSTYKSNVKRGKSLSGPYCSKSCAVTVRGKL